MMHKAWCNVEKVIHQIQGHTGWKIDNLNPNWIRLLGRSLLSNPSDLPYQPLSRTLSPSLVPHEPTAPSPWPHPVAILGASFTYHPLPITHPVTFLGDSCTYHPLPITHPVTFLDVSSTYHSLPIIQPINNLGASCTCHPHPPPPCHNQWCTYHQSAANDGVGSAQGNHWVCDIHCGFTVLRSYHIA